MFNRRNAVVGWLVWQVGKRVLKRKAKAAVPSIDTGTRRPNRAFYVLGLAGVGAFAYFWFRRGQDDEDFAA
jgi:hypothetical protein